MDVILQIDLIISNLAKILLIIFLLSQTRYFKFLLLKIDQSHFEKLILILIFSIVAILGDYNNLAVGEYITNTRALGIILGGLIGGPIVGIAIGIIAGLHAWYLAGQFGFAVFFAALCQGGISGYLAHNLANSPERWKYKMVGFGLETLHIFLLVVFNPPFDETMKMVRNIGPLMVLMNGAGIALVMLFIDSVYGQRTKVRTAATRRALQIANNTFASLSDGLTPAATAKIADNIIAKIENIDAIAITSTQKILAFKGAGEDHHSPDREGCNLEIFCDNIVKVVQTGIYEVYQTKENMGCMLPNCPLSAVVVVPLKEFDKTIGTLMLFKSQEYSITKFDEELALGLGRLISSKLEISKNQRQTALLTQAEINALQAQINPHFLFNALNTIAYYCRKEPETARELIIHLSQYYRKNMIKSESLISLKKEIEHVDSYVKIEMARFQGKLDIVYDIDWERDYKIPPLTLQPLVENAIKHGLYPKKNGGVIIITTHSQDDSVIISINDNGVGMEKDLIKKVLSYETNRSSIGLSNVDSRLKNLYGQEYGLRIESTVGLGTTVRVVMPLIKG